MSITYSYDVFDTIITRKTATPHGIFAIMQDKLKNNNNGIPRELAENFFELRVQGEHLARQFYCKNGKEEVTLIQIYKAINTTGLLDKEGINKLIEMECKIEMENSIPIPYIIQEILEHIKKKKKLY